MAVPEQTVLITVGVEDYFHVGAFEDLIEPAQWSRFERRLEGNIEATLDLFDELEVTATFFVMGWVAEHHPDWVRRIVDRGHEVASQGFGHARITQLSPEAFRADRRRAREALERATGRAILGHRVPHFLQPGTLWALDLLTEEGYAYDSSVAPRGRAFADQPSRVIHPHLHAGHRLTEVPVSSLRVGPACLPIAGGGWFRQLPEVAIDRTLHAWFNADQGPFVLYFHVWELDADQPRVSANLISRVRQYRNLERMPDLLRRVLRHRRGVSIAEHLGLEIGPADARHETGPQPTPTPRDPDRPAVSVVVPCYNESAALPFLANTLDELDAHLGDRYALHLVFVDDHSTDDTLAQLERLFGDRADAQIVALPTNRGVAGAIKAGIGAAASEIVCSIDCDCTYDPLELEHMLPRLTDGVSLVTASPYHPDGGVQNVPTWRLGLSRGASTLYRHALDSPLHTFTSCFRVYRRSAVVDLPLDEGGFLGVAELLARLLRRGDIVVEHPAVLRSRVFGHSKMKTLKAIRGHLGLLARLTRDR